MSAATLDQVTEITEHLTNGNTAGRVGSVTYEITDNFDTYTCDAEAWALPEPLRNTSGNPSLTGLRDEACDVIAELAEAAQAHHHGGTWHLRVPHAKLADVERGVSELAHLGRAAARIIRRRERQQRS